MESFLETSIRKGLVSKAELQESDFKRQFALAIKAHAKLLNIANDAVCQKGRMRYSLIYSGKTLHFWPTKQAGNAN